MGGLIGLALGVAGAIETAEARAQAKRESKQNRAFQERMSNTAYQRAVEDMKTAGINPILVSRVGGASTPSGNIAPIPDVGEGLMRGLQTGAAVEQAGASTSKATAAKETSFAAGVQAAAARGLKSQQEMLTQAAADKTTAEAQIIAAQVPEATARGAYDATPQGQAGILKSQRSRRGLGPIRETGTAFGTFIGGRGLIPGQGVYR